MQHSPWSQGVAFMEVLLYLYQNGANLLTNIGKGYDTDVFKGERDIIISKYILVRVNRCLSSMNIMIG